MSTYASISSWKMKLRICLNMAAESVSSVNVRLMLVLPIRTSGFQPYQV